MRLLLPIDGSDPSERALNVAAAMAEGMDATLDVVHVTDQETDATDEIVSTVHDRLDGTDAEYTVDLVFDDDAHQVGASTSVGEDILEVIDERGINHVVMGSTTGGRIESMVVGSASETVLEGADVPVTVVP